MIVVYVENFGTLAVGGNLLGYALFFPNYLTF